MYKKISEMAFMDQNKGPSGYNDECLVSMVLMEASTMYKDVTVAKGPQNNQHFGCYIQKYEK